LADNALAPLEYRIGLLHTVLESMFSKWVSATLREANMFQLRDLFGDPLLLRSARGMLPTSRALELLGPIKQVLDEIDGIIQPRTAFDPGRAEHTFTLSASDYVEYALLPTLVDYLERQAPRVRLAVRPLDLQTVARQMEIGEVDLCITGLLNAPAGLHERPLYTERVVSVVRRRHPGVGAHLTLDTFCSLEHILVSVRGSSFSARIDDARGGTEHRARFAAYLQLTSDERVLPESRPGIKIDIDIRPETPLVQPGSDLFAKLGHYVAKVWELLWGEPRESNTEGGLFPAIFGTVMQIGRAHV
jgi:hypothetical protein